MKCYNNSSDETGEQGLNMFQNLTQQKAKKTDPLLWIFDVKLMN